MSQAVLEQPRVERVEVQDKAPPKGRAEKGRFAKGNPGGPGNPFCRRMAMMREGITQAISVEQVAAMMAMVYEMAMERDLAAVKIVLDYAVGKPQPMADPDRVDVDEWALRTESRVSFDAIEAAQGGLPAKLANPIAEAMSEKNVRELGRIVTEPEYAQELAERAEREEAEAADEGPFSPESEAEMAEMTRQWKEDRAREQAEAQAAANEGERTGAAISAKSADVGGPIARPLANGSNGTAAPSPNGANDREPRTGEPSPNGSNGADRRMTPSVDL